jgi:hypothetical protein
MPFSTATNYLLVLTKEKINVWMGKCPNFALKLALVSKEFYLYMKRTIWEPLNTIQPPTE